MNRIVKLVAGKTAAPPGTLRGKTHGKAGVEGSGFHLFLQRVGLASGAATAKADTALQLRGGTDGIRGGMREEVAEVREEEGETADRGGSIPAGHKPMSAFSISGDAPRGPLIPGEAIESENGSVDNAVSEPAEAAKMLPTSISAFAFLADQKPKDGDLRVPEPAPRDPGPVKATMRAVKSAAPPVKQAPDAALPGRVDQPTPSRAAADPWPGPDPIRQPKVGSAAAEPRPDADAGSGPVVIVSVVGRETHLAPAAAPVSQAAERPSRSVAKGERVREILQEGTTEPEGHDIPRPRGEIRVDAVGDSVATGGHAPGDDTVAAGPATSSPRPQGDAGLPQPILQSIGTFIADAADTLSPAATPARMVPGVAAAPVISGAEPVRGMEVRLDLPKHGTLHVRMMLSGRALSVRISTEDDDTVHRLRNDRGELAAILDRAGYDADIVAVQSRPVDASALAAPATVSDGQSGAGAAGSSLHNQAGRERRQHADSFGGDATPNAAPARQNHDDPVTPRNRAATGFYV